MSDDSRRRLAEIMRRVRARQLAEFLERHPEGGTWVRPSKREMAERLAGKLAKGTDEPPF